jgi:Dna[CI] antecedent, DciA
MEPARTGLRSIMRELLRTRPAEEAAVLAWPVVCGREVAARTRAVSFTEGHLTVEVPDATWRAQLAAFAPRYVSGFAELIGPVVREVRFVRAISTQHSAFSQTTSVD